MVKTKGIIQVKIVENKVLHLNGWLAFSFISSQVIILH